jgi:hypothetical protein
LFNEIFEGLVFATDDMVLFIRLMLFELFVDVFPMKRDDVEEPVSTDIILELFAVKILDGRKLLFVASKSPSKSFKLVLGILKTCSN